MNEPNSTITEKAETASENFTLSGIKASVDKLSVKEGDVVIMKFDPDILPEELQEILEVLKREFPDNKVLCITNSMELLCEQREDAINLLNSMIAHISIVGSEKPNIIV